MDRFGGTVKELGMGMSNGGGAPGGTLGVGRFEFDDASPQFPATSDVPRGDSSIAPQPWPRQRDDWKWYVWGDQVVTVRLRGTSWALMSSLGCSPRSVLVGMRAMRAVLLAWL